MNKVDLSKRPFKMWTDSKEVTAQTVIIATGACSAGCCILRDQELSDQQGGAAAQPSPQHARQAPDMAPFIC